VTRLFSHIQFSQGKYCVAGNDFHTTVAVYNSG